MHVSRAYSCCWWHVALVWIWRMLWRPALLYSARFLLYIKVRCELQSRWCAWTQLRCRLWIKQNAHFLTVIVCRPSLSRNMCTHMMTCEAQGFNTCQCCGRCHSPNSGHAKVRLRCRNILVECKHACAGKPGIFYLMLAFMFWHSMSFEIQCYRHAQVRATVNWLEWSHATTAWMVTCTTDLNGHMQHQTWRVKCNNGLEWSHALHCRFSNLHNACRVCCKIHRIF
jgi:hypothetical protein